MSAPSQPDILSQLLEAVRLDSAIFFNAEFTAPWCLESKPTQEIASYLTSGAGHVIVYHLLREGRAYARLPDGGREELSAGDLVIFPHGNGHFLGNGSPEKPVDSFRTFAGNLTEGLKAAHYGGGGETTKFVCGFMSCEPKLSEVFLAGLPPMFVVKIASDPSGRWLENSIRFAVDEDGGDGAKAVLSKLAETLFIETLRRYINSLPPDQTGWLAGARDAAVGQALALLHRKTSDPWTVASLAKSVGLSRTRLAERFHHFLGEPPMAYLTRWRLKLGAERLKSTEQSVAEIALDVGYSSEAAFNRAFKRAFGDPPAQFRRKTTLPDRAAALRRA
jgi:AraC-like DNA-binding protein